MPDGYHDNLRTKRTASRRVIAPGWEIQLAGPASRPGTWTMTSPGGTPTHHMTEDDAERFYAAHHDDPRYLPKKAASPGVE